MSVSRRISTFLPSILISVPAYLAYSTVSPSFDIHVDALALVISATRPRSNDLALLRLFLGGFRQDDATGGDLFLLNRLNDQTISERFEIHSATAPLEM